MTAIFVDSSALVALLLDEPDWQTITNRIDLATRRRTSVVAMLETIMVVASRLRIEPDVVASRLADLLQTHDIKVVAVGESCNKHAVEAFARYGKGRHPARLNLGDCISYACAKEHGLTLLYKGDDFSQTDLA